MTEIFLRTLPFFAIIGLGYLAGRIRLFPPEATAYLTKFVFFFALSAMLFRFAATLPFDQLFDPQIALAYLFGTALVYVVATLVAMARGEKMATTAFEAQCAVIGNVGFLGIPMMLVLFGEAAIGPNMLVLAIDLIVFSSLIVILVNVAREGRLGLRTLRTVGVGLVQNPMIVSIWLGRQRAGRSRKRWKAFWSRWATPPRPARCLLLAHLWLNALPNGLAWRAGSAPASWCCTRRRWGLGRWSCSRSIRLTRWW